MTTGTPGDAPHPLPGWRLDGVDPQRMKVLALLLGDPNPIHLDPAAASRAGVGDRQVNQGPSTMAMAANLVLEAFPGWRLAEFRARLLGPVLAGDPVEAAGAVTGRETRDGQQRVSCVVHVDVHGARVLEARAVLVRPE